LRAIGPDFRFRPLRDIEQSWYAFILESRNGELQQGNEPDFMNRFRSLFLKLPRLSLIPPAILLLSVIGFWLPAFKCTRGVTPVPIDDAYIHAQYAKRLVEGDLYNWSPGDGYSKGFTSPLYPFLLAAGYALGGQDHWLMLYAQILNFLAVAVSMVIVFYIIRDEVGDSLALLTLSLWALCGPFVYGVLSGMEVGVTTLLVCWLIYFLRKEWTRANGPYRISSQSLLPAALLPLLRPDSLVLVFLCTSALMLKHVRRLQWKSSGRALIPLLPISGVFTLNALKTGDPWMNSIYLQGLWNHPNLSLPAKISRALRHLIQCPSALSEGFFGPSQILGSLWTILAILGCVVYLWKRRSTILDVLLLIIPAAQILFLTVDLYAPLRSDECFRYFQPYLPLFFIGIAFASWTWSHVTLVFKSPQGRQEAAALDRFVRLGWRQRKWQGYLFLTILGLLLIPGWLKTRRMFIEQSQIIADYPVRLGRDLKEKQSKTKSPLRILTHDGGALMYFSGVRGFDVTGLCHQVQGYPFREAAKQSGPMAFECLERVWPRDQLPDFAVMFSGMWSGPPYCAERLVDPSDWGATLLPDFPMQLYRFPKEWVGSGHRLPDRFLQGWSVVDELDVADLMSEQEHRFRIYTREERSRATNSLLVQGLETSEPVVDVGRWHYATMEFVLRQIPNGKPYRILARVSYPRKEKITIRAGEHTHEALLANPSPFTYEVLAEGRTDGESEIPLTLHGPSGAIFGYFWMLQPDAIDAPGK